MAPTFRVRSTFAEGEPIPKRHTCDGANVSPPIEFDTPPGGTQSLALILDDPDAPGRTFLRWIAWDLPPTPRLEEGTDLVSRGARVGKNDFGHALYGGPCPPKGQTHRYVLTVYAVDTFL